MLKCETDDSTEHDYDGGQPQPDLDRPSPAEPGMKQDEGDAEQPEPDVSLEPELGTADPPGRHLASSREQPGEGHHSAAQDPKHQPRQAASRGALRPRGTPCVAGRSETQEDSGDQQPLSM